MGEVGNSEVPRNPGGVLGPHAGMVPEDGNQGHPPLDDRNDELTNQLSMTALQKMAGLV